MMDSMSEVEEILFVERQLSRSENVPYMAQYSTFSQFFSSIWKSDFTEPPGGWPVGQYASAMANADASPIERAILAEYRELRLSSIEYFSLNLTVWPATSFESEFIDGFSDIKFYNFAQGLDAPHVLPVQVAVGLDDENHVLVKLNGKWQQLTNFLETLIEKPAAPSLSLVQRLWAENGKHFPLFDLPAEVRNVIYEYAMAPRPARSAPRAHPYRYSSVPRHGQAHVSHRHNRNLLYTNKDVLTEASYILYTFPTFVFNRAWQLESFLETVGSLNRESLRHMELHFTHNEYLQFFGARLSRVYSCSPFHACIQLSKLRLNLLELTLPPPVDMVKHSFLWNGAAGCQTKVVDWILGFARPYIQCLPVELDGYVKISQKERFMASLQRYKDMESGANLKKMMLEDETDTEGGGVVLADNDDLVHQHTCPRDIKIDMAKEDRPSDEDVEEDDIAPEYELPPRCDCETTCSLDEWTADD